MKKRPSNKNLKWRLAFLALSIDLIYLALMMFFQHSLSEAGNWNQFFTFYMPFFLHFPLVLLFFGVNHGLAPLFLSAQTFIVFLALGFGLECRWKWTVSLGFSFYAFLLTAGGVVAWRDRERETVAVILPTGFTGSFSIFTGQPTGEALGLTNDEYIVRIPENGSEYISNQLNGWHPYSFSYENGFILPFDSAGVSGDTLGCFSEDAIQGQKKFFIGTACGYRNLMTGGRE